MTITKFEHSCIVLEDQGAKLVIDPGQFSPSFVSSPDIRCVIITHSHIDHLNSKMLAQIVQDNEDVKIFAPQEVADAHSDLPITHVSPGIGIQAKPFTLEFFGGLHAIIHPGWAPVQNIGVCVNDVFYYPGDSFALPNKDIMVLAVPASAPWMKVGEAMNFLVNVGAQLTIPAHDALLSEVGMKVHDGLLEKAADGANLTYRRLAIGESITI